MNRKGQIQLIDASSFFSVMKRNLGDKGKFITEDNTKKIFDIYKNFEQNQFSKIMRNETFGYTKVVVEQPLFVDNEYKRDKKGNLKSDISKRDFERIPLEIDINEYFKREVLTYVNNAWLDRTKDKVGYEINFNKFFYQSLPLRKPEQILKDLSDIDEEIEKLSTQINN